MQSPSLTSSDSSFDTTPRYRFEFLRAEAEGSRAGPGSRPVLAHGLSSVPATLDPDCERAGELKILRRRVAGGNILRVHWFQELVGLLDGIRICPLKGIFLLDRIYQNDLGTRALGDLDLLVRREDLAEASERLQGWGMTAIESAPHHSCFVRQGLVVEMHTRLGYKHGLSSDWDAVAPIPGRVHERDVCVLDDSTTLVHLLSHFVKHTPFSCLKWVEDILRWAGERWVAEEVERVARRIGARSSVEAALLALRGVLGGELLQPLGESSTLRERWVARVHQRVIWPHIPDHPLDAQRNSTRWRRNLSALLLADRLSHLVSMAATKQAELAGRRKGGR